MTMAKKLAAFAVESDPPGSLVERIRDAVADCFGCILAGADSAVAQRLTTGLANGPPGPAPLYGTGRGAAPGLAALINAAAGHAHDLDDWEEPANTHPSVIILPAVLAIAATRQVSGAELVAAYAVGFETIARLGEAVSLDHYARGFHSTGTLGAVGVAAASARLMRLDAVCAAHALSLAATQASGFTMQFGTDAKPLQAGLAARAGLESALMAEAGATGRLHVLEDARGFAGLMGRAGRPLPPLGKPWALDLHGVILKPWPSCGYLHRLMTAALELRWRFDDVGEIDAVEARLTDFHRVVVPYDRPANRVEAMFSAPACVARTLVAGDLTLADGESRFWEDSEVARLVEATTVVAEPARNPALNYDPEQPDVLRARARGRWLEAVCAYPLGAPQAPMTPDDLSRKFAEASGRPASDFDRLRGWPEAADLKAFFAEHEG